MQRASFSFTGPFSSFKIWGRSVYQQGSHYVTREFSCWNSHPDFHGNAAWGDERAGSASTLLGEKTASISENAVLAFRFFPARFSKEARELSPGFPPVGRKTHRVKSFQKMEEVGFQSTR